MNNQIPNRLNVALVVMASGSMIFLLWAASYWQGVWVFLIGLIFALIYQTLYALLHEATHGVLHATPYMNNILGRVCATLYPTSYTLMRHSHIVHHCCNRSDHEMFDCYYPGDKLLYKRIQWYAIVSGLYWPLIPIGGLLLLFLPSLLKNHFWQKFKSTNVAFSELTEKDLKIIRLELAGAALWFVFLFLLLDLHWKQTLILYLMGGFLWSTRQYVTHAFTKRDVVHGALNLKTSWLMDKFVLHGGWDLVHHQNPHLSWKHLPEMAEHSKPRVPFWPQYFRLWKGPVPCREAAPEVLARKNYAALGEQ